MVEILCGDCSIVAIPVQVIGLFGYLVEILCENSSAVAIPVQVIGLFGYLVEILCRDPSSVAIHVHPSYLVIWLFGRNLMLGPLLGSCVSKLFGYLVIW